MQVGALCTMVRPSIRPCPETLPRAPSRESQVYLYVKQTCIASGRKGGGAPSADLTTKIARQTHAGRSIPKMILGTMDEAFTSSTLHQTSKKYSRASQAAAQGASTTKAVTREARRMRLRNLRRQRMARGRKHGEALYVFTTPAANAEIKLSSFSALPPDAAMPALLANLSMISPVTPVFREKLAIQAARSAGAS